MPIEDILKQNITLSPYTTYKIGGPAEYFVDIETKEDLVEAVAWSKQNNKPFYILAGGSNVLISDAGISGLVIHLINDNIVVKGERIEVEAGASLIKASRLAIANGLTGLEWAIGIPGTIGGAIRGNAGAYGSSIQDNVETVEVFSLKNNRFYKMSNKDCEFEYRQSLFKKNNDLIIWQATLRLRALNVEEVRQKSESYLEQRDKSNPKLPSAGCVFVNFTIDEIEQANPELAELARKENIVKNGKVATGWVIDQLDLRGKSIGGAKVSLEHANFIVNTSHATAADIVMLISFIKQQARTQLTIQLREEIQYLGFL